MPGQTQSDALGVAKRARERFEQSPRDRVFAIIDGEQKNLEQALLYCKTPLQRANRRKGIPDIYIEPIVSTPCFELWLLLHFRYCDRPFGNYADVQAELKHYLVGYNKRDPLIFKHVAANQGLDKAIDHAAQLRRARQETGANNPSTDMDKLAKTLFQMVPAANNWRNHAHA